MDKIKNSLEVSHNQQKKYYDRGSKNLKPLSFNETVRFQDSNNKTWKPAVVVEKQDQRSYVVRTEDGAQYRRNRRQLLKSNEKSLCPESMFDSFPNILDQSPSSSDSNDKKSTNLDENIKGSPIKTQSPAKLSNDKPYITRSGRVVKPNIIVSV